MDWVDQLTIRPLKRRELFQVVDWARDEGWNPGINDADIFWQTDPDGYLGAELNGQIVAAGSVVSYGGEFGFMGLFIVQADFRGKGIGTRLWFHRREALASRLKPGALIGMDGVFDMQSWYERGGFVFSHRNLRMQGIGRKSDSAQDCVRLDEVAFGEVEGYDQRHFGFNRREFLRLWIKPQSGCALGVVRDGCLAGYGVVRECVDGFKIGPLFADNAAVAAQLFAALSDHAAGSPLVLDVPEGNADGLALAHRNGMKEVFGCARMHYGSGQALPIPWNNIFGITTFELG